MTTMEVWGPFAPWADLDRLQVALEACEQGPGSTTLEVLALDLEARATRLEEDPRGLLIGRPVFLQRGACRRQADLIGSVAAAARLVPFAPPPAGLWPVDLVRIRRASWSLTDSRWGPLPASRSRTTGGGVAPWWPELRAAAIEAVIASLAPGGISFRLAGELGEAIDDFAVALAKWTPAPAAKYLRLPR